MKKNATLLFLLFLAAIGLNAQSNEAERCAFDRLHQQLLEQPAVRKAVEANERHIAAYRNSAQSRATNAIVTIPVVVHVFHCGEAIGTGANLPTAQITSAIANLNDAFAHSGVYADGMHNAYTANTDARFAFATTAPDGSGTGGILRVDLSGQAWGATYCAEGMDAGLGGGVAESTVKAVSRWPAADYMNIWLVHKIENGGTCSGTLGFASFPGTTAGTTDGLTVLSGAFGYDPTNSLWPTTLCNTVNLNGTADHEVGHYLNLYHTFEGDNNGTGCPTGSGDFCADIPPHIRSSGCPADSGTGNTCDSNGPNTFIHNFMDYADDACFHGFSNDQKGRIDPVIAAGGAREALSTSLGDEAPTGSYPTGATCMPQPASMGSAGPTGILLNGVTWISSTSSLDGGSFNRVGSQAKASLMAGTAYTLGVTLATVGHCNVYIDYNDDGDFDDANEIVHDSPSPLAAHSISFTPPTSGVTLNKKIRLRIIGDSGDLTGPCNALTDGQAEDYSIEISAPLPVEMIDFTAVAGDQSIFVKWTTLSEISNSGFELQRSTDPARGFSKLNWTEGKGQSLEVVDYEFEDRQIQVGQQYYYRLKQVDFSGNQKFSALATAVVESKDWGISIVPNPVIDQTEILFKSAQPEPFTLTILSMNGKQWMQKELSGKESHLSVDLTTFPSGIYFVKMTGNGVSLTERFVKQ